MIIVQERWSTLEPARLRQLLQAALPAGSRGEGPPDLLLLPIGEHAPGLEESIALGAVRDAAIGCGAVLAGALRLDVGTIGFLVGSDGQLLLRTPKILPDWAEGYSDTPTALAEPAAFGLVKLPQGQVAILVGEDATAAHLVRAAMWRGAEVVLNPSREFTDEQFGIRQQARMARLREPSLPGHRFPFKPRARKWLRGTPAAGLGALRRMGAAGACQRRREFPARVARRRGRVPQAQRILRQSLRQYAPDDLRAWLSRGAGPQRRDPPRPRRRGPLTGLPRASAAPVPRRRHIRGAAMRSIATISCSGR